MKRFVPALVALGFLATATSVQAAPFATFTDSNGLVYTLENNGIVSGSSFEFVMTVDMDGYTGDPTDFIEAVGFKVSSGLDSGSLTDPAAGWTFHAGTTNANGCQDSGGGFACAQSDNNDLALGSGGTFSWTFLLDPSGDLFGFGSGEVPSIKALIYDSQGNLVSLLSDSWAPTSGGSETSGGETSGGETSGGEIPEPASLLLLGSGLGAVALRLRRKQQ